MPGLLDDDRREVWIREYQALLMLRDGLSLTEIARGLPNLNRRAWGEYGVSQGSASDILRAGLRALTAHVKRERRPEDVPAELWPPPEVREAIREEDRAIRRMTKPSPRVLRTWIEASGAAKGAGGARDREVL